MNIEDYISSGIIESYVLGQLSEKESAEVRAMAEKNARVKAEIAAVEATLGDYARAHAKTPPAHLKKQILERIREEELRPASGKVVSMGRSKTASFKWLAAAAIILLVGSAIFNILLFSRLENTRTKLAAVSVEKEQISYALADQKAAYLEDREQMAIITKPSSKAITLEALPAAPGSAAMVFWDPASKEVLLNVASLPVPPSDKQYQLWAIVDGKPVDAGVFELASNGRSLSLQKMKTVSAAQAFAVTLEKKGGSPSPTMEAMCLMGKV